MNASTNSLLSNPPHKPPWFPEGDPLDPLINENVSVKLPQRYVGDTHQTYDVLITFLWNYKASELWKIFPIDSESIFANPFRAFNPGFDNTFNAFLLFERFIPGLIGVGAYANAYSEKVTQTLQGLADIKRDDYPIEFTTKDKFWDTEIQEDEEGNKQYIVNGKGVFFGEDVADPPYEKEIEVDEFTVIQFSWLEKDSDGSNKLNQRLYKGSEKINFSWQPLSEEDNEGSFSGEVGKVLPYSGVVSFVQGKDIVGEIEGTLPPELLYKNLSFPTLSAPERTNEKELLKFQSRIRTITNEYEAEVVPGETTTTVCCYGYGGTITTYVWSDSAGSCEVVEDIKAIRAGLSENYCMTGDAAPVICPDTGEDEIVGSGFEEAPEEGTITYMRGAEGFAPEYVWKGVGIQHQARPQEVKTTFIDTTDEEEINKEFFTIDLDNPGSQDGIYKRVDQFVALIKANNNYWDYPDFTGGDINGNLALAYNSKQAELPIDKIYFVKSNESGIPPEEEIPIPYSDCGNPQYDNDDYKERQTFSGLIGKELGAGELYPFEDPCPNGILAYRDEEATTLFRQFIREYTYCELKYEIEEEEMPDLFLLTQQNAINVIDSWWYAYFYPPGSDIPELINS